MQHAFGAYQIYTQHFWANLVQKSKIVSFSWNSVPWLIQICKIQWWCSLLLFQSGNTLLGQIWSKKVEIVSLDWNLAPSLIRIWRTQWWRSLLVILTGNITFWANLVESPKIVSLSWNLVPRLRYYATFKVRKFDSLFCKINTC